jgi:hypothetical protein
MSRPFPERASRILIAAMVIGILLIGQRYSITLFRVGLVVLVAATLLQIAVGNLPATASAGRSLVLSLIILGVVAAVFAVAVPLVPVLSQLGR